MARHSARSLSLATPLTALLLAVTAPPLARGQQQETHQERIGNPPVLPTRTLSSGNAVLSHVTIQRGPFVSRQVNVDGSGNNIVGDAANEPSIAIDPTDPRKIVIGWRQFDSISSNFRQNGWAYSRDAGVTWTFTGSVQPSLFNSDPVVRADAQGSFFYLSYPGATTLSLFKSTSGGQSWTGPVITAGGDKAWMAVDTTSSASRGNVYMMWQVASGPNTFIRSTNGGTSFSSAYPVPQTPTFGILTVDTAGTVYAAGLAAQNFGSFVLSVSTNAKDPLQTPVFTTRAVAMGGRMAINTGPNPGGLLGQANVATDPTRSGYVYLLCSVDPTGTDPLDVHFVRSTDGGQSFGAPVRVNDDAATTNAWQWFGTMAVAPTGRIDVVWNDSRNTGVANLAETFYAYSMDAGQTWSKNIPVTPAWNSLLGFPNQNKIGDYYDLASDAAAANLAYSATFNGEEDLFFLRLGDCNGNGVHDGVDIANGTSFDSNQNTIPDECELCQRDLGFGSGPTLSVCGDDLTKAGSRATMLVQGASTGAPVLFVLSLAQANPPLPIPGGNLLVPDIRIPGWVFVGPLAADGRGRFATTIGGGASATGSIYAQAATFIGANLVVSNALEVRIGMP